MYSGAHLPPTKYVLGVLTSGVEQWSMKMSSCISSVRSECVECHFHTFSVPLCLDKDRY